jgi:hypothetical protein
VVEPQHGPASLNEIERLHQLGFLGVMYHPRFQGVFADDPWIVRQVALLTDLHMVALFHSVADSGLESPTLLERVLTAVPDARIVVLDAFSSHLHGVQCIELGRRWPNVSFDTALVWGMHGLRQALAELGPHRLCFGSNLYSYSPPPGAFTPARFRTECGLSPHDADAILGSNLRRLLAEAGSTC